MATNYDDLYRTQQNALGPPTDVFVEFFASLNGAPLDVLDIGSGQGRDALFIARAGHRVTGVDLSPAGVSDMIRAAEAEKLAITGIVADVAQFTPSESYDIVLFDRTLHMLEPDVRHAVLARLLLCVRQSGWALIADEPGNMPGSKPALPQTGRRFWKVEATSLPKE